MVYIHLHSCEMGAGLDDEMVERNVHRCIADLDRGRVSVFVRRNNFGVDEWRMIREAVKHLTSLTSLNGFNWSTPLLCGGCPQLDLSSKSLGMDGAGSLMICLERSSSSLTSLNLR